MDLKCTFMLGKYDSSTSTWTWTDLERHTGWNTSTSSVRYRKCEGLEKTGKPKNIYTESYAESSIARVSAPNGFANTAFDNTDIKLTLLFQGESRQSCKDAVESYLRSGYTVFWDNIRQKAAVLLFDTASEPSEDRYAHGTPFFEADYTMKNINGFCPKITATMSEGEFDMTDIEDYAEQVINESIS